MNLLIVDDEPLIHVSLEYNLKEIKSEDVCIYHAYTGSEMMNQMETTLFDLVLVDIQLPGINGLTAIEKTQELYPQTLFYIMTSFSEFEYAREAVRLKVTDYLLKPLEPHTLETVLDAARKYRMDLVQQQRDKFLGWLDGTLRRHNMNSLYPKKQYASVLLLTWDDLRDGMPPLPEDWGLLPTNSVCIPCIEGALILLFSSARPVLQERMDHLTGSGIPENLTVFLTDLCEEPELLANQMHTMLDLSALRVFRGIGRLYKFKDLPKAAGEELAEANAWIALRDLLHGRQYNNYTSQLPQRIRQLKRLSLKNASIESLAEFVQVFTGMKVSAPYSITNLEKLLASAGENLLHQRKRADKIDEILLYVQEHCCEDISITSLANHFGLSANYLSTLLKNRLGIKFTDHITLLRLARAKELLLTTNDSIREITKQVGYYSQSYFNKIFQEKENCTPVEFRNRSRKDPGRS
jgi:YesN/AraC family two-component response regulator